MAALKGQFVIYEKQQNPFPLNGNSPIQHLLNCHFKMYICVSQLLIYVMATLLLLLGEMNQSILIC